MQTENHNLSLSDFDIYPPVADYLKSHIHLLGNGKTAIVGWLEHTPEPMTENITEVYGIHSLIGPGDTNEYYRAVGRDHYGEADIDAVFEHPEALRKAWMEAAVYSEEYLKFCQERSSRATNTHEYLRRKAARDWRDLGPKELDHQLKMFEDVLDAVWKTGVTHDPDALLLDMDRRTGQAWSLNGEGVKCHLDTAFGAGVWLPKEELAPEIERRSEVYAYGYIADNRGVSSRKSRFFVAIFESEEQVQQSDPFGDWHEAFVWLGEMAAKVRTTKATYKELIAKGRRRALKELARCQIETINDVITGSIYSVRTACYERTGEEWEKAEEASVRGHIGSGWAEAALAESVQHLLASRQVQ